jgi:acyl-CoA dehydrogenase
MDFALNDEQQAIVDLSAQILGDRSTPEHLKEVEAGSDWFDRDTWAELAKSELLGIALPESVGGGGFGYLEAALVLREAGRVVAAMPLWPTLVAALAIAEWGSDAQHQAWLPGVIDGSLVLTVALPELHAPASMPQVRAVPDGHGFRLSGVKTAVPAVHLAAAMLVPAAIEGGEAGVFIVPTSAAGITAERQDTFNHEPAFHVTFDDVVVGAEARLGEAGEDADVLDWMLQRATVAVCAFVAGMADAGMRRTAAYVTERKQFDRAIGSFQAVGHRMADCYVDNEAINLSMLAAASKLAEGASVPNEVAVAKYWASYGGSRIAHAGLHLHGGISIDLDYPIHRYFLTTKHLEFVLGGGSEQLARLGANLASEPVPAS